MSEHYDTLRRVSPAAGVVFLRLQHEIYEFVVDTKKKDTFRLNYERGIIGCLSSSSDALCNLATNIDYSHIIYSIDRLFLRWSLWVATVVLNVEVNNNLKSKLKPHHVLCHTFATYIFHENGKSTILSYKRSAFLYIHTFFIQSNTCLFCIFRRGLFYIIFIKKYWRERGNKISRTHLIDTFLINQIRILKLNASVDWIFSCLMKKKFNLKKI